MIWFPLLLFISLCYGGYNFLLKMTSLHMHQVLGAVVIQATATCIGLCALIYFKSQNANLALSSQGVIYAMGGGVAVAVAEILFIYTLSNGVNAAIGIPIVVGGSILFGSLLGVALLGESINVVSVIAIALIIGGVALLTSQAVS